MADEIVLIYEARIATVQLLEQIFRRLRDERGIAVRARAAADLQMRDLSERSFPLFVRADGFEAYRLAKAMQKAGIAYGYYLDDNFWELDAALPIGRYYGSPQVRNRLAAIMGGATLIAVATPALGDYLSGYRDRVVVADSFFDFALVPSLPEAPPDRPIRRAGFASSPGRTSDLVPVMGALIATLEARPDIEFEVIGAQQSGLPDHPRIKWFPHLPDLEAYIAFQLGRQWDFGIAPLADSASNVYKTDNKYREYAALGIPGIYQDLLPYAGVRDAETGLLVGPRHRTWREAIELYLDQPELRHEVRVRARADVERRRTIEAAAATWLELIGPMPSAGPAVRHLRRALARNRRRPPKALRGARELVRAVAVAAREEGLGAALRRAVAFIGRAARRGRAAGRSAGDR